MAYSNVFKNTYNKTTSLSFRYLEDESIFNVDFTCFLTLILIV